MEAAGVGNINAMYAAIPSKSGSTLLSTSQPQTTKFLVKEINTSKNARNLESLMAFDIKTTLGYGSGKANNREIEYTLRNAGASKSSSLLNDCTIAEFLNSPRGFPEHLIGRIIHNQRELSLVMRNVILVVAILIGTTTIFQAIHSFPSGVFHNKDQLTTNADKVSLADLPVNISRQNTTTNTTTNTTGRPVKQVLLKNSVTTYEPHFFNVYSPNTVCFLASIMAAILVLPLPLFSALLCISLLIQIGSYGTSFYAISPLYSYVSSFCYASYIAFAFVYRAQLFNSLIFFIEKVRQYHIVPQFLQKSLQMLRRSYG